MDNQTDKNKDNNKKQESDPFKMTAGFEMWQKYMTNLMNNYNNFIQDTQKIGELYKETVKTTERMSELFQELSRNAEKMNKIYLETVKTTEKINKYWMTNFWNDSTKNK
ncbi:MAG: hypothetical protein ACPKQO_00525 [Nitrososphaeraceae archaeon]